MRGAPLSCRAPWLQPDPHSRFPSAPSSAPARRAACVARARCPASSTRPATPGAPFQADAHDIALFLAEGHALFDLEIEGSGTVPVVVKEQQRHPVRGDLVHLDCQQVDLEHAIQADVALELSGVDDAPGVKEGGILEHILREITVEALPTDIPDVDLSYDVSAMVIGDTITLDDGRRCPRASRSSSTTPRS